MKFSKVSLELIFNSIKVVSELHSCLAKWWSWSSSPSWQISAPLLLSPNVLKQCRARGTKLEFGQDDIARYEPHPHPAHYHHHRVSGWWHCRILPCRSWRRQRWIYLKSDIFCKISKNFFRPWARHRLSLPVAKATLIADRRQRNCQKLPDPVCFKHFSLFRLSTVFTYLYFWASASSSCLKSVDKELEA